MSYMRKRTKCIGIHLMRSAFAEEDLTSCYATPQTKSDIKCYCKFYNI